MIPSVTEKSIICKGTVIPTDDAKLMVLFLSILGWSLLESLESIRGAESINNLHKKGGPAGDAPATSSMPKSVSFSRKGKISTVDGSVIAYLSLAELFGIYHG